MLRVGVQTKNAIDYENPMPGFMRLKNCGFSCVDFSLNSFLTNKQLYQKELNTFFDQSDEQLFTYFRPMKEAAQQVGIDFFQMHMPYPNYVPTAPQQLNDYLREVVAVKSMRLCHYLGCKYIVVHGCKLAYFMGSEEAEWAKTQEFLEYLAPLAKEYGITICIENIYVSKGSHIIEGPCCDAQKAVERIDTMNEKYSAEVLGFCFDTGHANLVGIDFERFLSILGPRLKVLHIHDNDGIADLHQVPFTFTKTRENKPSTDWDGFIRGLKKIDYQGVLNFETAPVLESFPAELGGEALQLIANIGKYFGEKIEAC